MNIIILCSDTFRFDHLGFAGQKPVQTPNLDRLAKESAHFVDFRLCSFPTILNRIEVFTGRYTFPFIDWGKLPFHFPVLAEVFKRHGYCTALIADNPHIMRQKRGFGRGFDYVKKVPGQTDDAFQPESTPMIELPCPVEKLEPRPSRLRRYRRNAYWYQQQGTNTTETVFREAMKWLEQPPEKFLLWVDSFDPHEPWEAPDRFLKLYPWNSNGDRVIWPHNGKASRYPEADLENMRSLYMAEISQSDYWIGQLLDHLKRRDQLRDTAVVFCSDHGFYLGEHGFLGKLRLGRPTTFYEELGHIPLLVRHPSGLGAGTTIKGLCQPPDLFVTALELAGIRRVPWAQGYSLLPRLHGQPSPQRFAVGGCHPRKPSKGACSCLSVWSDEWTFIFSPVAGLKGSELYHRPSDPGETRNVIDAHEDIAREHHGMLRSWLDELAVSSYRKAQLLEASPVGRIHQARQSLWMWRNQFYYRRFFRSYAAGA